MVARGPPKWLSGSGKGTSLKFFGASVNFRKTSFFEPSTPSMRKGGHYKIKFKEDKV